VVIGAPPVPLTIVTSLPHPNELARRPRNRREIE
jgi:hypothetical protein